MAQKLIIFENILNGDALLESKEIKALCNHQFGECDLTVGETDVAEELHDWLDKEMHKAVNGNYDQIYRMKASFGDIQGEDESGEYSGPVYVHLFEPDAAIDGGFLVFTCNWKGSIFSNNLYVIGVIADEDDIDRIISSKIKRDVPSERLEAAGVPSKQDIDRILGGGARYTVQADGTIDVEWAACGKLRIKKGDCKDGRLPLRFGRVDVNFDCSDCGLITLEGAPQYVREDFKCNNNKLTSLVGGPKEVKESYYCQDNQLTSLVGAPRKVGNITKDTYTSFDTGESWVTGYSSYCVFDCQNNKITSLEGVDMHLMGTMKCAGNCISKKKKFNIVVEAGTVRWGKQNLE